MFNLKDVKENKYYFKLIILYTIVLAIVYGYLAFIYSPNKVLGCALVSILILIAGIVVEVLYLNSCAKKRLNSKEKDKE